MFYQTCINLGNLGVIYKIDKEKMKKKDIIQNLFHNLVIYSREKNAWNLVCLKMNPYN